MAMKIDQKIVDYRVLSDNAAVAEPGTHDAGRLRPAETPEPVKRETAQVIQMHEQLQRPEMLVGSTYKIKTPLSEHALYVTINDIVLNEGTEHELRRPFEVFINSKNMEHFQWIVALTLIISAVFRKGGDVTFLVDELRSVFDPRGGYFKKGGKYMPSLVAEIGDAIESHLRHIGLLTREESRRPAAGPHCEEAPGVRGSGGSTRDPRPGHGRVPARRRAVRALRHQGGGAHRRVHDPA